MTPTTTRIYRRRAQAVLDAYSDLVSPSPLPELLTDLLTDLRHWCDGQNVDFEQCLDLSAMHHGAEAADTTTTPSAPRGGKS
jgi:hypothetical protein